MSLSDVVIYFMEVEKMICKACNFENKDGAAFCAKCGKPLEAESASAMEPMATPDEEKTTILNPEEVKPAEKPADDSEANTTVLTNNMPITPGTPAPAPQGFANGPAPMGAPMNGPKPSAPTPGMGMPAAAPKPMGAPAMAPMGGAPAGGPKPAAPAPAAKPAQPVKAKKSKGTIAYIVISIILILGLAGVGTWGYFHFTDKLDKAEEDKANMETELNDAHAAEIASMSEANSELESQITDLEGDVTDLESQISDLQGSVSGYESYDAVIDFAEGATAQGNSGFFASTNFVNLSNGTAEIKVYYLDETGTVTYNLADSSVATCSWGEEWENDVVATLYVDAVSSGTTTITLSNDTSSDEIVITLYVE